MGWLKLKEAGMKDSHIRKLMNIYRKYDAVFEDKGSNVYLFKDGKAVKTAIELGELRETDKISVVKGLKTGDKVIVAGVSKLADGDKVKLLGGNK